MLLKGNCDNSVLKNYPKKLNNHNFIYFTYDNVDLTEVYI